MALPSWLAEAPGVEVHANRVAESVSAQRIADVVRYASAEHCDTPEHHLELLVHAGRRWLEARAAGRDTRSDEVCLEVHMRDFRRAERRERKRASN